MMKKIILIAALCLSTSSVMAQENEYLTYPFKWGGGVELGYATAMDVSVRGQYYINKHLTWDVLQLRVARDFNNKLDTHDNRSSLLLGTGLRVYSPSFGPGLKVFAAASPGWGMFFTYDSDIKDELFHKHQNRHYNKTHNFAADFSAGIFVWQGLYVSYGCQLLHNGSKGNVVNHFANIGFELGSFKFKD